MTTQVIVEIVVDGELESEIIFVQGVWKRHVESKEPIELQLTAISVEMMIEILTILL